MIEERKKLERDIREGKIFNGINKWKRSWGSYDSSSMDDGGICFEACRQ